MADSDSNRFFCFGNIPDDSPFVERAMHALGFLCDFGDLTTDQMQIALSLAAYFKQSQEQPEVWES